MLDADTKRRIDTARDILVGKVPDPKSQVEQITIALIYKFMDDIDAESEELGGKRKYFAGEFGRYGWARLMQPGLGGHEMLGLYAEAIERMDQNAGIPQLFRDIFSNAFLPYRDPETLRVFLKVIDGFNYDNSERLGDAFEYLLSVMDSQGNAGQFRTPRHIIDFIVSIVDPKKEDVVLDPACGTAGFLISSYKHIVATNTDADGNSTLTPDERARLARNLMGYDISPDMVRLSLVNMYLHGLVDPHIYEYDTLTSEERWNDFADVILANPPFMSPKGGIRPHKRFSVESKRSEVLFVDYMAEHLKAGGRAGIIVPEGIIFQSQNAHKQLRKKLVEECLVAVVSLPGGVFNPYSGVKTSILMLDKALARKTDRIAFYKVENDGYDLGAQRRPIELNDLPQVGDEIATYMQRMREVEVRANVQRGSIVLAAESRAEYMTEGSQARYGIIVEKEKVRADGEYSLSGERYRENGRQDSSYPFVRLNEIAEISAGNSAPQGEKYFQDGKFPFIRTADVGAVHLSDNFIGTKDKVNQYAIEEKRLRIFPVGTILFPKSGASTFLNHRVVMGEPAYVASHLAGIVCDERKALARYLYRILCQVDARDITPDQNYPSLRLNEIGNIEIPLPPLKVQQEIVAEIEGYQKVIDGARAVVENYRPHIHVDPEWPMVELGGLCERIQYGLSSRLNSERTGYKTFRMHELVEGKCVDYGSMKYADVSADTFKKYQLRRGDVLFNRTNSIEHVGRTGIFDLDGLYCFASYLIRLSVSENSANPFYVNAFMNTADFQAGIKKYASRAIGQSNINAKSLAAYLIPLPELETQQAIVAEIEAEQSLVDANRELIERFEKKIRDAIARVWEN